MIRGAIAIAMCALLAAPARADRPELELDTALKSALVVSESPDDPALFPERDVAASLWRARLSPTVTFGERATITAAYEERLRVAPQDTALGLAVLPSDVDAPYRLTQLDWQLGSGSAYTWRHEIDRLAATVHAGRFELTAGRQAIGWGRGVLFSAVDLFAPFTPLEADREWRRGVDALRAEATLTDTTSADVVAALGPSIDESAFAGRVRGYRGSIDLELIGGWRARDLVVGVTSSAAIADAEVHGELAVFRAPDPLPAGGQLDPHVAVKALLGGSYRLDVGNGVLLIGEYHYSGFGATRASAVIPLLANPSFVTRFARGDTQILGRHAIAVVASYEVSPELQLGLRWLHSPAEGSGVATPTVTATLSDRLALIGAMYIPYGSAPAGMILESEYGATPLAGFAQLQASY